MSILFFRFLYISVSDPCPKNGIAQDLLGVYLVFDKQLLGGVPFMMFDCVLDRILLRDGSFEKLVWRCSLQGYIPLGTFTLAT